MQIESKDVTSLEALEDWDGWYLVATEDDGSTIKIKLPEWVVKATMEAWER